MSPTLDATCHGEALTIDGQRIYVVSVRLTASEMDAVLSTFDEASATSPSAADCRAVARPIVVAVRDALGGG
jgi:hypothetical protein